MQTFDELFGDDRKLVPDAKHILWAIMLWPRDEELRRIAMVVWKAEQHVESGVVGPISMTTGEIATLLNAPDLTTFKRLQDKAQEKGELVGYLVPRLYGLVPIDPSKATLAKTIRLCARELAKKETTNGEPIKNSAELFKSALKAFAPVLHLWAAHCFQVEAGANDFPINPLLRLAEHYLTFLSDYKQRVGATGSVTKARSLVPDDVWAFSDRISITPLSEEEKACLVMEPGGRFEEFMGDTPAPSKKAASSIG